MVKAGVSAREFIEQSSCFVFQDGMVMTFNDEVACRKDTHLKVTGAVQAAALLAILEKMPDDELDVEENEKGELEFRGKGRRFGIVRDAEIFLPIDRVENPEKWKPLAPEFTEAVGLTRHCVSTDENKFLLTCIHIHPEYIESCQPTGTMVRTSHGDVLIENLREGDYVWSYSLQKMLSQRAMVGRPGAKNQWKEGHRIITTRKRKYNGNLIVVKAGKKTTKYTTDHECLVKLSTCFQNKFLVYLQRKGNRYRVGVTGPRDWKEKWANGRNGFCDVRSRLNAEKADACWILTSFDNEADALIEEHYIVARYGIPDIRFRVKPGENRSGTQSRCNKFWERFGSNILNARNCLAAYGRLPQFPFVSRKDGKGSRPSHKPTIEMKVHASNLMDGMSVLDADVYVKSGGKGSIPSAWIPIQVSCEKYSGLVHTITVEHGHTYVGDGIVTHNCDNLQMMRCHINTGMKHSLLVRGTSLEHITSLAMDEISLTQSWLHFRNKSGLVYSCRRYEEQYPELENVLAVKGHRITLPKGLSDASDRAAVFASDRSGEPLMTVELQEGRIRLTGEGLVGWYKEVKKAAYEGPPLEFVIAPELLKHICDKYSDAKISQDKLKVSGGGGWDYVTVLGRRTNEAPEKEAQKKE